ncbi:MAG: hypothetical protein DI535_12535, partial [Citrobacter freundii]
MKLFSDRKYLQKKRIRVLKGCRSSGGRKRFQGFHRFQKFQRLLPRFEKEFIKRTWFIFKSDNCL